MTNSAVARSLQPFGESIFTTMTRLANEHGAINLSQGFPDFDGPDWLKEAAIAALRSGPNQYAASPGNPALRLGLAAKAQRDYGLHYDPDHEITVVCGATEALAAVCLGLLNPGDEAILFEPYYDSYPACVAMSGAKAVPIPLQAPDYKIPLDVLESKINSKTRAIFLNTPCNPSGKVFSAEELEQLRQVLLRHPNILMFTDEVYEHILFDQNRHVPFATLDQMKERTVLISSFSKTLSMTGWKVGYLYAPAPLTVGIRSAHQFLTFCAASPFQSALSQIIDRLPEYYAELHQEYQERRDLFLNLLNDAGFTTCAPGGTYFAVVDVSPLGFSDGVEFCRHITIHHKVAAIPAKAFYSSPGVGDSLVRFAFCKGLETLREAGRRLKGVARR